MFSWCFGLPTTPIRHPILLFSPLQRTLPAPDVHLVKLDKARPALASPSTRSYEQHGHDAAELLPLPAHCRPPGRQADYWPLRWYGRCQKPSTADPTERVRYLTLDRFCRPQQSNRSKNLVECTVVDRHSL
ncbi:hypothetical protein PoB_005010300 [Plakobranchus ocellatus]|uniref:Uncharacterized protein n=1 Tax=Plakobranchus ocellatus TaxID=259542 RepID=A0AAV4BWK8_9GAST|nr:hypothetical protein PoB_005010300 [Plakobranchus ocellatus]